ncbi:EAL domain-containing protein [Actinotalea ferrariae]|uniref:putative bifunctional diguanylate cyclase/phosphodiesterase n=1 Tax=Actinotalea ferrariae TaxID=1386098 RepID=UPI001C8B2CC7|nr:EAL domain-containing protein [Actinotalea ferrariae]MBX9244747.1 EAL domain-containing protein [Actinotalea ferrariae]
MSAWGLVAGQVLLYAAFPFCFAFFRRRVRLVLCYVYIAMVLLVGGFFGSVYTVPVAPGVELSAGSVLYGALVLTAFMLVAGGHDPRVIRNVVKIVVVVNLFKIGLLLLTAEALRSDAARNPFGVPPEVFSVSMPVVLMGGLLIIGELMVITVVLEALKVRVHGRAALAVLQVALFVGVLVLDGVAFPVLVAPSSPDLGALVAAGVQAKLVLALAYAVPLATFVAAFGLRRPEEEVAPLRFSELFFTPRNDLLDEVARQHRALEASARKYQRLVESTGDAVVGVTRTGHVSSWNAAAGRLYRATEEQALGRPWAPLLLPRVPREEADALLRTVLAGTKVSDLEIELDAPDGSRTHVSVTLSPVHDGGEVVGIAFFGRDTTERHRMQEELAHQALHDTLTGLPNRSLLVDRLDQALAAGERAGTSTAVLFLDLDQFKMINDSSGHHVGDELLLLVAERLAGAVRPGDTVARFGGDEFVVLCPGLDADGATAVGDRLLQELRRPFRLAGQRVYVTVSIGIAVAPGDPQTLLRQADAAMYAAKARGRGHVQLFDHSMSTLVEGRLSMAGDLRDALEHDRLALHYQPVVDLGSGRLIGLEALARWHRPGYGWVPPDEFVPLAEANGMITDLTAWALHRACTDGARALRDGVLPATGHVGVNLSGHDVSAPGLVETVRSAVEATDGGFAFTNLVVEVTESVVMIDVERSTDVLNALQELGVTIAIDDFGTGYSSLTYLRRFPARLLKIDRSFTSGMVGSAEDRAVVTSVVQLASALNLATVAEGVETEEQREELERMGCSTAQGYLWSPARPIDELVAWASGRAAHATE